MTGYRQKYYFLAICFFLIIPFVSAQLIVTNSPPYDSPDSLVKNVLLNPGVSIFNVRFNGAAGVPTGYSAQMIGYFDGSASNIGISNGVVICTGPISVAPGPNNNGSAGPSPKYCGYPGDADLDYLASTIFGSTIQTMEAAVLEFDFTSASDKVSLRYVFASEEYPEYVCSEYTDVFAFFISGPGITGKDNIADFPVDPVAINTINGGVPGSTYPASGCQSLAYSAYYVNNGDGTTPSSNPTVQFDGFTTVLTATANNIIPCETYHMKICIADASDCIYDSGVFLETASFGAPGYQVHIGNVSTSAVTVKEGCGPVMIIFSRAGSTASPYTVYFTITGTAANGIDYTQFADSVVIPAGSSDVTVFLDIFVDLLSEGSENITITIPANIANGTCMDDYASTATVTILNTVPLDMTVPNDTVLCPGETITLIALPSGGVTPYTYSWSTGAMGMSITVTPSSTTTYTVTVTDNCNTDTLVEDIEVKVGGLLVTNSQQKPAVEGCGNAVFTFSRAGPTASAYTVFFTITGTATNGIDYAYIADNITFPPGVTYIDLVVAPVLDFIPEGAETVIITVIPDSGFFCTSGGPSTATATIINVDSISMTVSEDTTICAGNIICLTASATGGSGPLQYSWDNSAGNNDTVFVIPLDTTTYTVNVQDTCGNSNTRMVTINVIPPPSMLGITSNILIEGCKDAVLTLTRNDSLISPMILFLNIGGTAGNGSDYNMLSDSIFMFAGQHDTTLVITPFYDGISEINEEIIISLILDSGCLTFLTCDTVSIINVDPVSVSTSGNPMLCTRENTVLSAFPKGGYGAYTYLWTDMRMGNVISTSQTVVVNPPVTNQYSVLVTDSCGNTGTVIITVYLTGVSVSGTGVLREGCDGMAITITRASSDGDLTVEYRISGTSNNGQDYSSLPGFVVIPDGYYTTSITIDPIFDASPEGDETMILTLVENSLYDVCPDSITGVIIRNTDPLTVAADGDTTVCTELIPISVRAKGGVPPYSYVWSSGSFDTLQYFNPGQTTLYFVTVHDSCGTPSATDSVRIIIDCEYQFIIPSAFTPNGDGLNDIFIPVYKGIRDYEMFIADRWGDIIFSSDDVRIGWDGKANNGRKTAQMDVYVFKISTTDLLGTGRLYIGRVTLIR